MLSQIVKTPLPILTLGSRAHAMLLSESARACSEVFARDKETCHVCGTAVPGFMEVDHVKGHKPSEARDLRCICPFCHDLRHPLWAAAHRRFVPIHAPDLTQVDVTRLAWTLIGLRGNEPAAQQAGQILEDVKKRRNTIKDLLACTEAEPLFEAAFTAFQMLGEKKAAEILLGIDQYLRFFPSEVLRRDGEPVSAGLSSWRLGGFTRLEAGVVDACRGPGDLDVPRLQAAANSVSAKGDPKA